MDLSDLNVLKQESNGGSTFIDSKASMTTSGSLANLQSSPPPIPSRNNQILTNNGPSAFNPNAFGSIYNGYNSNNPNTSAYFNSFMSPFPTSGYGLGINNNLQSSNYFMRAAEENSRSAFQSIESVVHAFSAVSAMFESTYYAVYNSFRAVVGVADQFYRLKTHLSGILSALAIFRFLKYLYRKLLRLLKFGVSSIEADSGDAWSIAKNLSDSEKFVKENYSRNQTNWPLIMFLGVVLGGPYLLWKVLNSVGNKDDTLWLTGKIDHFIAASEHDFDALNVDELSFRRGQRIIIAPKEYQPKMRGWLLATVDGKTQGIVPANYIKILGKKTGNNSSQDTNSELQSMPTE